MDRASSELLLPPAVQICMHSFFSWPLQLLMASVFRRVKDAGCGQGAISSVENKN